MSLSVKVGWREVINIWFWNKQL